MHKTDSLTHIASVWIDKCSWSYSDDSIKLITNGILTIINNIKLYIHGCLSVVFIDLHIYIILIFGSLDFSFRNMNHSIEIKMSRSHILLIVCIQNFCRGAWCSGVIVWFNITIYMTFFEYG
jgi:hypothetical protein